MTTKLRDFWGRYEEFWRPILGEYEAFLRATEGMLRAECKRLAMHAPDLKLGGER